MTRWVMHLFCFIIHTVSAGPTVTINDKSTGDTKIYQAKGCENYWLDLHCPDSDKIIELTNARYGRFSTKDCPLSLNNWPGGPDNEICYFPHQNPSSIPWNNLLSERCNGRRSCMSFVTYWISGWSGHDASKYVEANYTCISPKYNARKPSCLPKHENCKRTFSPTGKHLPCCDGMTCEQGRCIDCQNVGEACTEHLQCCGDGNYCVQNVCAHGTPQELGLTQLQGPASIVMNTMAGNLVRACEEQFMDLSCPTGTVIKVLAAAFGRWSGKTCTHGHEAWANEPLYDNRWCNNAETNVKWNTYMQKQCNGRQFCMERSSNHVAGDPCGGVYKYTETRYECVSASDSSINERPSCLPLRQDCQRDFKPLGKPLQCCDGMSCEQGVCIVCKKNDESCDNSIECCGSGRYCVSGVCKEQPNPPKLKNMCDYSGIEEPICT